MVQFQLIYDPRVNDLLSAGECLALCQEATTRLFGATREFAGWSMSNRYFHTRSYAQHNNDEGFEATIDFKCKSIKIERRSL